MIKLYKSFFTVLLFLSVSLISFGQGSTTSSMSGKITDSQGEALAGATIVATHVPSGTVYGATANVQGLFSIQGMRPGGPYKVDVTFIGYSKESFTDINLSLGETFGLNVNMKESSTELTVVTVVGAKPSKFNT